MLKGLGPPVPAAGLPAHTQALAEAGGAGPQAREWEGLGARRPPPRHLLHSLLEVST